MELIVAVFLDWERHVATSLDYCLLWRILLPEASTHSRTVKVQRMCFVLGMPQSPAKSSPFLCEMSLLLKLCLVVERDNEMGP